MRTRTTLSVLLLAAFVPALPAGAAGPGRVRDAEAASHSFDAARYQVKDTYQFPGFKIIQYELGVLSHYSYLLVSAGQAMVIDPGRDAAVYLEAAKNEGATLKGVWLSHSHADFIAGHVELAKAAPTYVNGLTGAKYEHKPVREGQTLPVGDAVLTFLETPGHTPDSMCAVVASRQQPARPLAVFTGDTLFVGSVGRPDLLGEGMAAAKLASMMFDTWTQKLSKLPDETKIFPAHGAGSLCGAHLSDEPTSTIGQQRTSNPYLTGHAPLGNHGSPKSPQAQRITRGDFVAHVLEGLPEAPQYFQHNAAMNHDGPEPVDWNQPLAPIKPDASLADARKYYVVDLRNSKEYATAHIPNSVNIDLRGRLENWVGIMVPWDAKVVLVGANEKDLQEASLRLHRIGYNRSENRAQGMTWQQWKDAGLPVRSSEMIPPRKLYAQMQSQDSPIVLDVRLPSEWMGLRIGRVINIPLSELAEKASTLDSTQPVVAVCNSAYRSTMAVGLLERAGFEKAASLEGGGEAWIEAGLPVYEAKGAGATGASPKRQINLAERLSAAELKRMILDLPGTFQLVDIRPPEQFADYRLPGAENVDVAELVDNAGYHTGAGPLVIVDRDGSLAMMVAGILSQKTQRPIKALYGGLMAYWSEAEFAAGAPRDAVAGKSTAPATGQGAKATPAGRTPGTGPAPASPVTKSKKRSAGC